MSFYVIRDDETHQFAEELSKELGCLETEWGMPEMTIIERSLARADVIVYLIDESTLKNAWLWSPTNKAGLMLNMARERQAKEGIKLIQPVLCGIGEDQYTKKFPFTLSGLNALSVKQLDSEAARILANEIRSRIGEAKTHINSPLLIHLNAYKGASPWMEMTQNSPQGMYIELCKTSEHQSDNRSGSRYWDIWKAFIDEKIIEQANICAKHNVDVQIAGQAPLSLYTYLGMRLNRIPSCLWHYKTQALGQCPATKPDVYKVNSAGDAEALHENMFEVSDIEIVGNSTQPKSSGQMVIFVSLDRDHYLSQKDIESIKETCAGHLLKVFVIHPKTEGRLEMNTTNFLDIQRNISHLFQQCIRNVPKDEWKGLVLICTGPTPLAFFLGTLAHPHVHGDIWCPEYQNRKYVAAFKLGSSRDE
jgi:hypothetical protein